MLYAFLSALWIVASGKLLEFVIENPLLRNRVEMFKGLAFVAVTGGLLYLLLKGWCESIYADKTAGDLANVLPGDTAQPRIKRLALIFVVLALVVPLMGFAIFKIHVPQVERAAFRNLEVIARLKSEQIENWLFERRGDCEVLAGDDAFAARVNHLVRQPQDAQLARLLLDRFDQLRSNYQYTKILLLDTRGRLLLVSGDEVTAEPVAPGLWQGALSTRQVQQRTIYRDEQGHVHLEWAVPIVLADARGGRAVAVVVLRITAQRFIFPLIESWPTASASGETMLVRREGNALIYLNQLRQKKVEPMTFSLPLVTPQLVAASAIRQAKPGTVTGVDYRGVPVLAAFRPVVGTGWHVVSKMDREEVLQPIWDMVYWISLVVIAAIAAIMAVLLLLWRQQQRTQRLAIMAQSAAMIAESELKYRTLADSGQAMIWTVDTEKLCDYVNKIWLDFTGRSFEQEMGNGWAEGIHPDDFQQCLNGFVTAFDRREKFSLEYRLHRHDGEYRWIQDDGCPRYNSEGVFIGYIGYCVDITERKYARQKLAKSEEHFRSLFENMLEGYAYCRIIFVHGVPQDFVYMDVNHAFESLTGLKDVKGKKVSEVIPGIRETNPELFEIYGRVAQTGQPEHFENYVEALKIWFSISVYCPEQEYFVAVFDNITERKQLALALTEKETRLRTLVETIPDLVWAKDVEGVYLSCNPMFERFFGAIEANIVGKTDYDFVGKELADFFREHDRKAMAANQPSMNEEWVTFADDGHRALLETVKTPMYNSQGVLVGVLGIARDITVRKRTEEALRTSREDLSRLLNSMAEGVYGTDIHGNCTFVNRAFLQMLGYRDENEVLGQHIHELIHHSRADGSLYPSAECKAYRAFRMNESVIVADEVFWRKDGVAIPVEYRSHTIQSGDTVIGAIVTFIDITERKRMEVALRQLNEDLENKVVERTADLVNARQEAEQANRAKSDFLSTMSHEIRTPMNGVIGMVDVLQQSSLNGSQIEMTNIIHDSAFALLSIIDDILDFSKIESGRLQIENVPMSVSDVVEAACVTLSHNALKKGVELMLFTDPGIPAQVMGDPGRLRQILINLAGNAIKFSSGEKRQGKVSVRTVQRANARGQVKLEFNIADNGIGMDDATLARLFTPFSQADSSTTRTYGGTGLGLAISRQLSNLMGGEISVRTELGKGSTFCVHLSFDLLPEQPQATQNLVAGIHCLVVGDTGGMEDDLATYLEYAGAQVEREAHLATVKQWIAARPPGLCIVLIDSPTVTPTLNELRDIAHAHPEQQTHFVVIRRGKRREPRFEESDIVSVDGNVLSRRALLKAVAVAAGKEQVSDWRKPPGEIKTPLAPLSREEAQRRGCLILVAEDNDINQKVILQQLMLLGKTADVVGNGRAALEFWQRGDYALLLTDLHMPEMDGYELTAAIRAAETGQRHLPIIAFTANALKGEAERCLAIGMDDYLSKPVQLINLKAMLEKWMPAANGTTNISNPTHPVGASLLRKGRCEAAGHPPAYPLRVLANPVREQARSYNEVPGLQAVDVNVLNALIGDDEATLREFLHDFRISAAVIAAELRAAYMTGQVAVVAAQAHKLKSSARAVGALALAELCAGLEKSGKAGETETLARLMPEFERELANVERFLESY
jgi:PAS domain S-box-containing protein